jgi:membrane-bound lytic murein transglycosylase F
MDSVMPYKKFRLKVCWLLLTVLLLLLTACNPFSQTTHLEKIQQRGEIIMGTINSSLTYSYDGSQKSGFDYELGKKFANYLNVGLQVEEYDTLKALFTALDNDEIDFIGAGLTLTRQRAKKYRSSPPYYYVSQQVVYYKGTYRPRKITDVKEPIGVLEDSSHQETLLQLLDEIPDLKIAVQKNEDQESLLRKIAEKEIKFALVDSTILAQKQRYYPVLAEAFTLSEEQPVSWLIKRGLDNTVYSAMIEFIGNKYQEHYITKLQEKYFGHVESFDFFDTKVFLKRIETVLPKYEALFKKYTTPEIDWTLLAAVSYQESHWNPKAKSPTGVRGMMMLTLTTAKSLGIKNRLNAKQSIKGGAKYLAQLINRLPDSISDNEKIWFALASYNIGYGHLMDARRITAMGGGNPNLWSDVKDNLPLLHQKKWYKKTRYGYARGKEAQHYVNNIRQYRKTLTWLIAEREKQKAQEIARQAAKEKALAEQARHAPLSKAEALQKLQKEILEQEAALQLTEKKILEIEQALQQAKEKTLAEESSMQMVQTDALALQQALKENEDKALAAENAFQKTKESILSEQKSLQEAEEKALIKLEASQLAKEKALAEQLSYEKAKEKALAEQRRYQKAKKKALAEQKRYQESGEERLQTPEEAEQPETETKEEKALSAFTLPIKR